LSVGIDHAHAINSTGELWGWGRNADRYGAGAGRLGDNTATTRTAPVKIGTDTNWAKALLGGYNSALWRRTDGTLWFSGEGAVSGNNDTTSKRSSPTQIGSATDWDNAGISGNGAVVGTRKV
jgi:alpha-tubulin suppressor-like RCC1 family protein